MKYCQWCNGEIVDGSSRRIYCSERCGWAAASKRKRQKRPPKVADTEYKCVWCGKTYKKSSTNSRKIYCSKQCRTQACEAKRKKPKSECAWCGSTFYGRWRTCSPECALALSNSKRLAPKEHVCVECGTKFTSTATHRRVKYCSQPCASRAYEKRWRSRQPPRVCTWCGKSYQPLNPRDKSCSRTCAYKTRLWHSRRRYVCTICGVEFTSNFHGGAGVRENRPRTCGASECKQQFSIQYFGGERYATGYRKACTELWGDPVCILCGSDAQVEAHHISGDITDDQDVLWLCHDHHVAIHHKYITTTTTPEGYREGLSEMWYLLFKNLLLNVPSPQATEGSITSEKTGTPGDRVPERKSMGNTVDTRND